jgi:hypothetical protein
MGARVYLSHVRRTNVLGCQDPPNRSIAHLLGSS